MASFGTLRREQGKYQEMMSFFGKALGVAVENNMLNGVNIMVDLAITFEAMGEEAFVGAWRGAFEGEDPPMEAINKTLATIIEERRKEEGESKKE